MKVVSLRSKISVMKACCAPVVPVPNWRGGGVFVWGECETLIAPSQIVAHFAVFCIFFLFLPEIIQLLNLLDSDICHFIKSLEKNRTLFLMSEIQTNPAVACKNNCRCPQLEKVFTRCYSNRKSVEL